MKNLSPLQLKTFATATLCLISVLCIAQSDFEKKAFDLFTAGNYREALPYYAQLAGKDPKSPDYNLNLGICYLHAGATKLSTAIPYLEKAANSKKAKPENTLWLAKGYLLNEDTEKAEAALIKYKSTLESQKLSTTIVDKLLANCRSLREHKKSPVNVTFENAGPAINSRYRDYNPFVSDNESFIIFNSTRGPDSKILPNGEMMSDVYISKDLMGKWEMARGIGNVVNEIERNEEVVGVAADGKTIVVSLSTDSLQGELLVAPKEGDVFYPPQKPAKPVNTTWKETAATLSPDGNTIYFTSDREGTIGGLDLFRIIKLPNGEWSEPMNLGKNINTPENEEHPFVSADGKKLFFSSEGHNSMGGYDIFSCTWNEEENRWNDPVNLGYPVNNATDNLSFCISETGRYGYLATDRMDSQGDLDIYRVIFNDVEPQKTLVKGYVASAEGSSITSKITLEVHQGKKLIGMYTPNQYSGKYIMILEPGVYDVSVGAGGYKSIHSKLEVLDKSGFEKERVNEIYLLEK